MRVRSLLSRIRRPAALDDITVVIAQGGERMYVCPLSLAVREAQASTDGIFLIGSIPPGNGRIAFSCWLEVTR